MPALPTSAALPGWLTALPLCLPPPLPLPPPLSLGVLLELRATLPLALLSPLLVLPLPDTLSPSLAPLL